MGRLIDRYGRIHRDLRVSLTDRCSLRCTYCMPAEGLPWLPGEHMLTTPELLRVVDIATQLGVKEVRLTGGEPLLRPDVVDVVAGIAALPSAPELSLTTNALRLPQLARPLADAGLRRVNISLDTLDADTFRTLAKRDRLAQTLTGIEAAQAAGLAPVKINSVLLRGVNDHEAPRLLRWALANGLQLRFIEQMPLDPQHGWDRGQMITAEEILERLSDDGFELTATVGRGAAPAELWRITAAPAGVSIGVLSTVGIVGSVTRPFCASCDRVRLTADGAWRSCLFAQRERDLRTPMRAGVDDGELARLLIAEVARKQPGHGLADPTFLQPVRPMSAIGG